MKLKIDQAILSKGLAIAGRSVSTRGAHPILQCVKLIAGGSSLWLVATDLRRVVTCELQAVVEEQGSVALPWRLFAAVIAAMPPEAIELRLNDKTQSVVVTCGRSVSTVKGESADEFPLTPRLEGAARLDFAPDGLRQIIRQVALAAADEKDTSRPALTGVKVVVAAGKATFAASDGYRLSVSNLDLAGVGVGDKAAEALVPADGLREAGRLCDDTNTVATVGTEFAPDGKSVAFRFKGNAGAGVVAVDLVCQLIDAKYPNYAEIVPKPGQHKTRLSVNVADFQRALKAASLFAHDSNDRVVLELKPDDEPHHGILTVRAESAHTGDHSGELTVMIEGEPITMAVNVVYLLEALGAVPTDSVAIETTRSDRPMMLTAAGEDLTAFRHVLMPMQIPMRGASPNG